MARIDSGSGGGGTAERSQFGKGSLFTGEFFRGPIVAVGERGGDTRRRQIWPGLVERDVISEGTGISEFAQRTLFGTSEPGEGFGEGNRGLIDRLLGSVDESVGRQFDQTPGGGFADEATEAAGDIFRPFEGTIRALFLWLILALAVIFGAQGLAKGVTS